MCVDEFIIKLKNEITWKLIAENTLPVGQSHETEKIDSKKNDHR